MNDYLKFLVASLAILLPSFTGHAAAQAKPHIVIFISDDHGQLDSEPYGATRNVIWPLITIQGPNSLHKTMEHTPFGTNPILSRGIVIEI